MLDANFDKVIHPKRNPDSRREVLIQAYYAGFITKYASLIIYGIGGERGTYGQFANLKLSGANFKESKNALTYFTDIYSTALRNKGRTPRKTNYYLSQLQEIMPVVEAFGLRSIFDEEWDKVKEHDLSYNLAEEYSSNGKIKDWEHRAMTITLKLEDFQCEIMEAVTQHIMKSNIFIKSDEELIQMAFIEGLRGFSLGVSDIEALEHGESIISKLVA